VSKNYFGRDFAGLCKHSSPAWTTVRNPDEATAAAIKKLLELERKAR